MRLALLTVVVLCLTCSIVFAQDSTSIANKFFSYPDKFLGALNKKTSSLDAALTKQTEKYLHRLQRKEEKLKRRLFRLDSNTTKNLFLLNTDQQYASYLQRIRQDTAMDSRKFFGEYLAPTDSLQTSLSFLKQNPQILRSPNIGSADFQAASAQLQQLQAKLQDADQLKQYIRERKDQIKQYLLQFAHLPPGITSIYNDYNKELYYYSEQVKAYKEELNDPDKLIADVLHVIEKLPAFQSFFQNNSMLAAMFPANLPGSVTQNLGGLQTRDQLSQIIQAQLSGPNGQQTFSQGVGDAQSQISQLRDRIMTYGQSGSDMDMPGFKPNTQKTKTFLSRIEYGTNIQSQHSSILYPVTTDLGVSIGYKINDNNTIGVGGSFKMGWGSGFNHISLSGQGASIRSFADIKMKGSFYVSGGFEYNYQQPFYSVRILNNLKSWQQSGLIGISKIVSMHTKVFKKTKLQVLWDFLSYQQIPKAQAFKFRIGYTF